MNHAAFWQQKEQLALLRGWTRDGVPQKEIARRMGLKLMGLRIWSRRYPAIGGALQLTGEITDYQVEEALLKAALGYRYTEEKTEQTDKGDKLVTTEKDAAPNVSAISLWLKRKKPEMWDGESTTEAGVRAENNLFAALGSWQEEVFERDAVSELQQTAEAGGDVVENGAVSKL